MSRTKIADKIANRDISKKQWNDTRQKSDRVVRGLDRYPEKSNYREVTDKQRVEALLRAKRDAHDRVLNIPPLEGFRTLGEREESQIKDFLAKEHPDRHLNDINISHISYNNEVKKTEQKDIVLGEWGVDKRMPDKRGKIEIYRQNPTSDRADLTELKETLSHEVGHNVFFRMDNEKQLKWQEISGKRDSIDCVTPYATKDLYEDFAESYSYYINHANELKNISEPKYNYMRDEVFDGRIYDT